MSTVTLFRRSAQLFMFALLSGLLACGGGGGGGTKPTSVPAASLPSTSVPASSVTTSQSTSVMASSVASSVAASPTSLLTADIWSAVSFWGGDNGGAAVGSYSKVTVDHQAQWRKLEWPAAVSHCRCNGQW
jgi:hypothetical protein